MVTHASVDLRELQAYRIDVPANERELDPILLTIPLQLLAYHAALALGHTTSTSPGTCGEVGHRRVSQGGGTQRTALTIRRESLTLITPLSGE